MKLKDSLFRKKRHVILMDCETRTAEGIIHSLFRHGLTVVGLSSQKRCPALYSACMDLYFQSPFLKQDFGKYFDFLTSLSIRGVIVPSGDLSVQFLSSYSAKLQKAGFLLNIVNEDVFFQAFDKWKCHELCKSKNVPIAKTEAVDSEASVLLKSKEFTFPAIIKPTRMAGGNYVRVFSSEEAVSAFRKLYDVIDKNEIELYGSGLILQEWIDSRMEDNWSCDVFYDQKGILRSEVTIKRIRTSLNFEGTPTSRLYAGKIHENKELLRITRKILESIGWRGLAHVEYIRDRKTQKFFLTEINPRLPGYSYFLSRTGYEYAYFYTADLLGIDYATIHVSPKATYFEALRYPGDITDGVVNAMRGHLHFGSIVKSYISAFFSKGPVVIDHWNSNDIRLSGAILFNNGMNFLKKTFKYVLKRLKALVAR